MGALYLIALLVSIAGCVILDLRWRLALAVATARTLLSVGIGVAFFFIWDMVGIGTGVFFRGHSPWLTGYVVAPEVPVEELFFLTLLSYTILLTFLGLGKAVHAVKDRRAK
jgi:lycopene cyclase domain-containing protein